MEVEWKTVVVAHFCGFFLLAGADPASSQSWEGLVCWERGMQPCRLCARTCQETWRVGLLPHWHLRDSWRTSCNQLCGHEVSVRGPGICCQGEAQVSQPGPFQGRWWSEHKKRGKGFLLPCSQTLPSRYPSLRWNKMSCSISSFRL